MNWLAHVFLSESDIECRLGNLLADVIKGKARDTMSPRFQRGLKCHQAIDAFTDYHPIVHRSTARISEEHRRFAGILVDVFYDHFLAKNWDRYAPMPLDRFTAELYESIRAYPIGLPAKATEMLQWIVEEDRLGSYRHVAEIEVVLQSLSERLAERLQRPFALERAISDLTTHTEGFESDFAEFFPQLQAHIARWHETHPSLAGPHQPPV
jgi:acyl carrier protein phosphodiesterase